MTTPTQADIGPTYDLLLATRDGSTLPCRNKDGQIVNLSSLAFMTSIDRQAPQHEETELQHKDNLVQLASSNLIDREFSQWPQVTQGDWSGGTLQRVLTGGTPLTSFGPQSDPTRYWDGLGVLWPIADYLPQQGVLATPDQAEAGAAMTLAGAGVTGGQVAGIGGPGPLGSLSAAYAYMYMQTNAPQHNIIVLQGDTTTRKIDPAPGSVNGTPFNFCDYCFGFGEFWYVWNASGVATVNINAYNAFGPPTVDATTSFPGVVQNGDFQGRIITGQVGNKQYVAVLYEESTTGPAAVRLFDVTGGVFNSFTDVPLNGSGLSTQNDWFVPQQIAFLGDSLIIGGVAGQEGALVAFSIAGSIFTTLARFPATANLYFVVVAGTIFLLAAANSVIASFPAMTDMYLVQGSNVQHIGALQVSIGNVILSELEPVAFGPYAAFAVYYRSIATGKTRVAIYAYDVLRGRLFKMNDIGDYTASLGIGIHSPRRMALLPFMNRPVPGGTFASQWGVSIPILSSNGADVSNAQNLLVGVSSGAFQLQLRQGTQITSSIIDFTSAQPKLFRQALATWRQPGLPADANVTVRLDVWLDQDPDSLNAVPDFTTGAVGTGVGGGVLGQTKVSLNINKIATKIVYRITTTGPFAATSTGAVKLVSVIVRAASGWTRTMLLDLGDNAMTNSKMPGETCWSLQTAPGQPALDATAAYNFMRQLWRLKGGEVIATFPNGDPPANWLLQDIHWDSPKPFGVSFRADQKSGLGYLCQVKLSEDV